MPDPAHTLMRRTNPRKVRRVAVQNVVESVLLQVLVPAAQTRCV